MLHVAGSWGDQSHCLLVAPGTIVRFPHSNKSSLKTQRSSLVKTKSFFPAARSVFTCFQTAIEEYLHIKTSLFTATFFLQTFPVLTFSLILNWQYPCWHKMHQWDVRLAGPPWWERVLSPLCHIQIGSCGVKSSASVHYTVSCWACGRNHNVLLISLH